ncbi:hypothetical protein HanPSC8_Chr03g0087471 [Helianthus annuus]|nr:hypothetical protein HanPSC8_Chr03g0087471 [Helianthus annuus]
MLRRVANLVSVWGYRRVCLVSGSQTGKTRVMRPDRVPYVVVVRAAPTVQEDV